MLGQSTLFVIITVLEIGLIYILRIYFSSPKGCKHRGSYIHGYQVKVAILPNYYWCNFVLNDLLHQTLISYNGPWFTFPFMHI